MVRAVTSNVVHTELRRKPLCGVHILHTVKVNSSTLATDNKLRKCKLCARAQAS